MIGRTISHYSVTEKLGAGGMGEVYRATDTKLNRDVALKVLPEVFASDAQRMARFSREAQVLASLNHPNIASIYGLEESGGIRCLVLELVEGPTLAERIAAGPLPAEEALNIARQIAEALEAAHEKGIIHRDLKPANVKVTPEGTVKVLDFGLAKALEDDPSSIDISKSPTLSVAATQAGLILGTAAYMSPEQARGQAVDKRADIWSFGVVLFEMLTGKRTFSGETVSDTLAAVLRADVDWVALPADTPASIRKLLGRVLAKDPKRRLQAIGEARITIEDTLAGAAVEEPGAVVAPQAGLSRQQRLILAVGMVVVAAAAGFIAWTVKPAAPDPPLRKFKLVVEDLEMPGNQKPLAISPNGTKITYLSNGRLWIRELHHLEPREVPGSQGAVIPFWSPDSAFLGYAAQGKLWKFPVSGGDPTTICDLQSSLVGGAGATWGPDGRIVFSEGNTALFEVSALGGDPKTLLELDPEKDDDFHQPSFLPDGRGVVFVVHRQEHGSDTLALFAGGTRKVLLQLPNQSFWSPVYSPTGHILYRRVPSNAGIWALPFSLSKLEVTGEPFLAVAEGAYPNVSSDGTLIYVSRPSSGLTQLAWVNRSGQVETAIGQPQQQFPFPALSPDGRRVAIEANENDNRDIWIHDVARGTKTRLTFAEETEGLPTWSPVGDQIVFQRGDNPSNLTIFVKAADGTGEARELAKGVGPAFSPDGKYLVYAAWGANLALDLWYRPVKGSPSQREYGEPVVFLQTQAEELWPRVSPDGRYLAYGSNESGRREVYVKMFPSGQGKWQVSVNGGFWPRWSKKGDKLYYVQVDDLMEVEVSARPSLTLGTPKKVFTREPSGARLPFGWPEGFDVAADGQRFVLVQNAEGERSSTEVPGITVVENWFTEFKDGQ